MNLRQCFLTNNDCYKKNVKFKPIGIMLHSTGAANDRISRYVQPDDGLLGDNIYDNDWNKPGLDVCVHAFIGRLKNGDIATYQTLPWDVRAWHAGRAYKNGPTANDTHLSFEVCEDYLTNKTYFDAVYKEMIELCVYLCKMHNFDPLKDGVIIDHAEGYKRGIASNHGDITHWLKKFGKNMDIVRKDIYNELNKSEPETKPETQQPEEDDEMRYNTLADLKKDGNARFYVPTIERLLAKGVLNGKGGTGDNTIIDLGEDSVRLLVILDREGIFN